MKDNRKTNVAVKDDKLFEGLRPRLMTLIEYSGEDAFTEEEPQLAKTC